MSEPRAKYKVGDGPDLDDFKDLPCALQCTDPLYKPPTPEQIADLQKAAGWSQVDVAKITGVSYDPDKGSATVVRWRQPLGHKNHRDIPYSAWRLMLIYAGVVEK